MLKQITYAVLAIAILGAAFVGRATYNLERIDYTNANFVFFWLAGRMMLAGQNPYESTAWIAAHDQYGVTWRPNLIFPYPLPLALFVAPFGLFTLETAYFLWQLGSELVLGLSIWSLLARSAAPQHRFLLVPVVLALLYFGPVFLTLQIGALGLFTLGAVTIAMRALDDHHSTLAGLVLSLTLLKPPHGLPLLLLLAAWFVARRQWKVIHAIVAGAGILFLVGVVIDPGWLMKFGVSGQAVLDRTIGLQANAFGLAYMACGRQMPCTWWLGAALACVILGITAALLWKMAGQFSSWEALSISAAPAFFATLYLWSYDQALYVIPLIWIMLRLLERTRSYAPAFAFLGCLLAVAFAGMLVQAGTRSDLVSLVTTMLIFGGVLAMKPWASSVRSAPPAG